MNNLWKIHSVGGFYQNIVPIFDDVRYSLNEAFIISKPKCLGMCAPGCFFYQSVCQSPIPQTRSTFCCAA